MTREPDPDDGRRRLVRLTPRGFDCLHASAEIFEEIVTEWRARGDDVDAAVAALSGLAEQYGGRLRPIW